ncbi:hypothetical protein TNCV_4072051 [Trichonephila clavipes]|uniref:Uncharacterized protein n=1 Tax=Trichonephila clavipes TaxID=2585209 RepID=A0A8X6W8D8_TRICX|nr:hypothetical protein TNCV_4072051 [Trichonephila clavipes]
MEGIGVSYSLARSNSDPHPKTGKKAKESRLSTYRTHELPFGSSAVYTDGSKRTDCVGSGVVIEDNMHCYQLDTSCSDFTAKTVVIYRALQVIDSNTCPLNTASILTPQRYLRQRSSGQRDSVDDDPSAASSTFIAFGQEARHPASYFNIPAEIMESAVE